MRSYTDIEQSKKLAEILPIESADMWLNSTLDNFHYWSKQKRKSIAHKWTIAKNLSKGKYNYYFNSGNKEDAFREEVAYLAESMGIKNYTLTIE